MRGLIVVAGFLIIALIPHTGVLINIHNTQFVLIFLSAFFSSSNITFVTLLMQLHLIRWIPMGISPSNGMLCLGHQMAMS